MKTTVLLVNLGTPQKPEVKYVRKFLREFLNDKHVINIPVVFRWLLTNIIIAPFRAPKTTLLYKKIWTTEGSPLLVHSQRLHTKLQNILCNEYTVHLGMRYQEPNLKNIMNRIQNETCKRLIIIPLFPQYSSATTGSVIDRVLKIISQWTTVPEIRIVKQFYDNPLFIKAFAERINSYHPENYDHILFSFHGLPLSQVNNSHNGKPCSEFNCSESVTEKNKYCYQATSFATARELAKQFRLSEDKYTICFQSRFSKNWLTPFTDEVIREKAKAGIKKILVVSPSFVADCIETIEEIQSRYRALFISCGGHELQLVESLNDSDTWTQCLKEIVIM
ncbi:MAG: ferrochelatase [Bacteroidota bacterium]|nr:ferrochelatase [Bacteroidota bacterium]